MAQLIRGSGLGLALIMYGCEEGADMQIEDMTRDQDPILRHSPPDSCSQLEFCSHLGTAFTCVVYSVIIRIRAVELLSHDPRGF